MKPKTLALVGNEKGGVTKTSSIGSVADALQTMGFTVRFLSGDKGSNLAIQYGDRVWSFLSWCYRQQIGIIKAHADTHDARVISPDDSFVDAGVTPSKYGGPDPWHMNTAYGRLTLKQALTELGLLQG